MKSGNGGRDCVVCYPLRNEPPYDALPDSQHPRPPLAGCSGHFHAASGFRTVDFSNTVALFTLFQYNHDTNLFSSNIRFRWEIRPGSDFYIVYNETDDTMTAVRMKNRSLAVKLNYLFAF